MKKEVKTDKKIPYVCGPLTELPADIGIKARAIYIAIANMTEEIFGVRAFVPHEHFDPLSSPATSQEVYNTESERIKHKTSLVIVVAIAPSWGGGGEIQLANEYGVPIIICKPIGKSISKYILGMSMVNETIIEYDDASDLITNLMELIIRSNIVI